MSSSNRAFNDFCKRLKAYDFLPHTSKIQEDEFFEVFSPGMTTETRRIKVFDTEVYPIDTESTSVVMRLPICFIGLLGEPGDSRQNV
jgi:hypothetical protein